MPGDVRKLLSVFGGTGFVGGAFCRLSTAYQCLPIARDSRLPESDDILYLISTTHNYHVFDNIHLDVDVNLTLLLDVLKNLKGGKHTFNFVSSWFVYGETSLPATEASICHPRGFYSITKYAAEQLIESYCQTFGIAYRILRLCNVYGPGDRGASKQKNALQYLVECMRRNEDINVYYDGNFYRDYMYIDDVVRAIELCITEAPLNRVINVGSGERRLFGDLLAHAKATLGSQSTFKTAVVPEFHKLVQVKDFYMDTSKLTALGFAPSIDYQQGIEKLCQ